MEITAEIIVALREKTGCGMMDCKAALKEVNGDMEQAADFLRKKGLASAARRADRVAAQGLVESYIHTGGKIGVLVEVNSETDFVARNEDFTGFARNVAMQIAASAPQYISRDEMPDNLIGHEAEVCLLDQPYIRDPKKTIKDLLAELVAKIGEKIVIRRFARFQLGEKS